VRVIRKASGIRIERIHDGTEWLVKSGGPGRRSLIAPLEAGAHPFLRRAGGLPVRVARESSRDRDYWYVGLAYYVTDECDLTAEDVAALLNERENRKRLRLQRAHALQAMADQLGERGRRQSLPRAVQEHVWQRDRGQCVACGSNHDLEFDHVIPVKMGGSNTERNIQLLCASCNRRKGATLAGEDVGSSTVLTTCPHCGARNRAPGPLGRRLRCGSCRSEFVPTG
jgi:5-methylcytosine-specific restriction endonuclease McrA